MWRCWGRHLEGQVWGGILMGCISTQSTTTTTTTTNTTSTTTTTTQGFTTPTVKFTTKWLPHTAPQALLSFLLPLQASFPGPCVAGILLPRCSTPNTTITAVTTLLLWH